MQPTLTHITATGIDRSTVPVALLALQRRYPLAEFGLLLSAKPQESPRFPDVEYLSRLEGLGLRLSLHLCGSLARSAVRGDFAPAAALLGGRFRLFRRIQLNITGYGDKEPVGRLAVNVPVGVEEVIIQQRDANHAAAFLEAEQDEPQLSVLLDASGGRGLTGGLLAVGERYHTGFAGGFSPENIGDIVQHIKGMDGVGRFWVDAESRLRDEHDRFDFNKVEQYLKAATEAAR